MLFLHLDNLSEESFSDTDSLGEEEELGSSEGEMGEEDQDLDDSDEDLYVEKEDQDFDEDLYVEKSRSRSLSIISVSSYCSND